jgi:hypothetical protein
MIVRTLTHGCSDSFYLKEAAQLWMLNQQALRIICIRGSAKREGRYTGPRAPHFRLG